MSTTPLGPLTGGWTLETSILQTIEMWLETYLSAVQRAASLSTGADVIPRPDSPALQLPDSDGNQSIEPTSIHGGVDFLTSSTELMPEIILTVEPDEEPVYFGNGDYTVTYTVEIGAQCYGQTEDLARMYSQLYGTAVSALMIQQCSFGRTRWARSPVTSFVDTENPDDPYIVQTVSAFTVYVDSALNDLAGIDAPVETDPITDPDPSQTPPDWPTVEAVNIALQIMAASQDTSDATFTGDDVIEITE